MTDNCDVQTKAGNQQIAFRVSLLELAHLGCILVAYMVAMAFVERLAGVTEAFPFFPMLLGSVVLLLFTLHWVSKRDTREIALGGWLPALALSILLSLLLRFTAFHRVTLDGYLLVFLIPLAEELYFRGILMDHLLVNAGRFAAVVLTTVLFALLHLPIGTFIPMLVLGFVLALLTVKTKRIASAIILHAAWNFLVVLHGTW